MKSVIAKKTSTPLSSVYKSIFTPFYKAMQLYIAADMEHAYEELQWGGDISEKVREEIYAFRISSYVGNNEYLIPKNETEVTREKSLDKNSYHTIVRCRKTQEIVGVMRLVSYPFEMSFLGMPVKLNMYEYSNYLELSRLIVARKGKGIGKRLLIHAGLFAMHRTNHTGFMAICRDEKMDLFNTFGLQSLAVFELDKRPGSQYHLIKADFDLISGKTFMRFVTNKLGAFASRFELKRS
jgi:hypothetical protein